MTNNITYTFEIEEVDNNSSTMLVKYFADGYPTISISMRLPFEGEETLEDVIRGFSPLNWWREILKNKISVDAGVTGDITVDLDSGLTPEEIQQYEVELSNSDSTLN